VRVESLTTPRSLLAKALARSFCWPDAQLFHLEPRDAVMVGGVAAVLVEVGGTV
jgi:hypothetical protein